MNSKQFLLSLVILTVLALSFTSAALTLSSTQTTLTSALNTITFNLTNSDAVNYTSLTWSNVTTNGVILTLSTLPTSINAGLSETITGTVTIPLDFAGNLATVTLRATNNTVSSNSLVYTINNIHSVNIIKVVSLTRDQNATIIINNTGILALTSVNLTVSNSKVSLSSNLISSISAGLSETITAYFSTTPSSLESESITLTAKDSHNAIATTSIGDITSRFCRNGTQGELKITNLNINNLGEGDDEEWNTLDDIEIEVEVSNDGDSSITDVTVDMKILSSSGVDVTDDFNLDEDSIDLGKITDGNDKTATFVINNVPSDIAEFYRLYFKAYKDGSESSICIDSSQEYSSGNSYQTISVTNEFDQGVAIKDNEITNIQANCGDNVELSFNVYNIGLDKEESTLIIIENRELGLDQFRVVSDLGDGDKELLTFNFNLPKNLTKANYDIAITTYFDYDEGDVEDAGSYDQSSYDDMDKSYKVRIAVSSCQVQSQSTIAATLTSAAKVGAEMVVKATIVNTGITADYVVSAENYDSWADLISIEPQIVSIPAGTSKEVTFKFKPTTDGTQTFNIKTVSNGKVTTQAVEVSVSKKASVFGSLSNTWIYVIAGVVVLLILIVLVMIIRVANSSKRSYSSDF